MSSSIISTPSSEVLQELVLTSEYSEGTALIGRGGFLGEESWSTINSEDSKNLQELQNLEFLDQNSGGTGTNIEESDEVSSVSTLVRILCLKFSLNPLRFSLMRETDTKMTTTEKLSKVINNCKNNHLALGNLAKLVFGSILSFKN